MGKKKKTWKLKKDLVNAGMTRQTFCPVCNKPQPTWISMVVGNGKYNQYVAETKQCRTCGRIKEPRQCDFYPIEDTVWKENFELK